MSHTPHIYLLTWLYYEYLFVPCWKNMVHSLSNGWWYRWQHISADDMHSPVTECKDLKLKMFGHHVLYVAGVLLTACWWWLALGRVTTKDDHPLFWLDASNCRYMELVRIKLCLYLADPWAHLSWSESELRIIHSCEHWRRVRMFELFRQKETVRLLRACLDGTSTASMFYGSF